MATPLNSLKIVLVNSHTSRILLTYSHPLRRGAEERNTMKKYRVREGSIADYARYAIAGFVFFVSLALIAGGAI